MVNISNDSLEEYVLFPYTGQFTRSRSTIYTILSISQGKHGVNNEQ